MPIIFDMDGTLIDTVLATAAAFRQLAPLHGLPLLIEEEIRVMIGVANPEFYLRLFPSYPPDRVLAFGREVEHLEAELIRGLGKNMVFPGVEDTLKSLREQKIRLSIASTGDRNHVHTALESTDLSQYFEEICCGEADKTQMLRRLCAGKPEDFLMIGDTDKDSSAARNNKILSVGALFGYCTAETGRGFDLLAKSPQDILSFAAGLNER